MLIINVAISFIYHFPYPTYRLRYLCRYLCAKLILGYQYASIALFGLGPQGIRALLLRVQLAVLGKRVASASKEEEEEEEEEKPHGPCEFIYTMARTRKQPQGFERVASTH